MAKLDQITQSYLNKAAANPGQKHEICRDAAYTFMGLAMNPKNARAAGQLAEVGRAFAFAAASERPPVMEDFANLLQETAAAYEKVGPWGDDAMDLIATRRELNEERAPRTPGQVFITPESFNQDVTLGRSQKIKWNPTDEDKLNQIQQNQTVAFWQGTKKEAQAMTVDVSLLFSPTLQLGDATAVPINTRAYAEIEFGSDGNKTKFRCDVCFGKRLTVVGNYISVNVAMGPPRPNNDDPVIIEAGSSIGAFAAPSLAPVVLTEYIDLLAPGMATPLIPIPLRGVQLLPIQSNLAIGETLELRWTDYGGNGIATTFIQQGINPAMAPIPITGDIGFVSVFSAVANVTIAEIRLPFQLSV